MSFFEKKNVVDLLIVQGYFQKKSKNKNSLLAQNQRVYFIFYFSFIFDTSIEMQLVYGNIQVAFQNKKQQEKKIILQA